MLSITIPELENATNITNGGHIMKASRMIPHNILFKDKFSVGIYKRLSQEDRNKVSKDDISKSIENQEQYLHYAFDLNLSEDCVVYKEYFDDDYTGINFNRPGYDALMQDIKDRKVDCILVKDFSRYGRDSDYIKRQLENDFENKDYPVRFVAHGDNFDSGTQLPDIGIRILLFLNEEYSRNQHTKTSTIMHAKQVKGEYIAAFAPYGYNKDPKDKHHLIIDNEAAEVVKLIFGLRLKKNMGTMEISNYLNERKILSPAMYREVHGSKYVCGTRLLKTTYWTANTISSVLRNETYIGSVVQGKRCKKNVKGKSECIPKSEWKIVPKMHDPIINAETFENIQKSCKSATRDGSRKDEISLFAGVLKCGDCGRAMRKLIEKRKDSRYIAYNCGTYRDYKDSKCTSHFISEQVLEKVVLRDLNIIINNISNLVETIEHAKISTNASKQAQNKVNKLIRDKEKELVEINYRLKSIEDKYIDNKITYDRYLERKEEFNNNNIRLEGEIQRLRFSVMRMDDVLDNPWVSQLANLGHVEKLDKLTVLEMIDKILVYEDRTINIVYRFSDELSCLFDIESDEKE